MTYVQMPQQPNWQQTVLEVLIAEQAAQFYSQLQTMPLAEQKAVVAGLREYNEAEWQGNTPAPAKYNPLSIKLNDELVEWQLLQNMHRGVIGQLERLVQLPEGKV